MAKQLYAIHVKGVSNSRGYRYVSISKVKPVHYEKPDGWNSADVLDAMVSYSLSGFITDIEGVKGL